MDSVKVLVRRGELLAQLDGVGEVEAAESADEHIADEPGDVLELLRQALHKNVKAEVLLMTDDDGEIEHQHPDEQVAAELLAPPDGRVEHVSCETENHPLCGWGEQKVIQKNHLSL